MNLRFNVTRPHSRFTSLQEIDYEDEFYFKDVIQKFLEKDIEESKLKRLALYHRELRLIYVDIALIVSRINEDGSKINRMEEIWEIIDRKGRITQSEADELASLRIFINYFLLDCKSLFINILIFMDKLARFLNLIIEGKNLRYRDFDKFRKDLKRNRGKQTEEFSSLILDNTGWFEHVKNLRDDFVVHHPGAHVSMGFADGKAYATLETTKTGEQIFSHISMVEIDSYLTKLKKFLESLDEFLTSHYDS